MFGGPRTGKTQWLAGRVLDAPGAVLVTSTRTDLSELCGPLRDRLRGRRVALIVCGSNIAPDRYLEQITTEE